MADIKNPGASATQTGQMGQESTSRLAASAQADAAKKVNASQLKNSAFNKRLNDIQAKADALSQKNAKIALANGLKANEQLAKAAELKEKILELEKSDIDQANIQKKKYDELVKSANYYGEAARKAGQKAVDAHKEGAALAAKEKNDAIETWKNTSLMGKAYGGLTSTLGKVAGGLTAGALAGKALSRVRDAALLQQKIELNQFGVLGSTLKQSESDADGLQGSLGRLGGAVGSAGDKIGESSGATEGLGATMIGTAGSALHMAKKTADLSVEIAQARGAAILLGQDVESVTGIMADFARITGSDNPKALGLLTQGALSVATSLKITTAEAVDYVSLRMEKFGGTAAGAMIEMQSLRDSVGALNHDFGRVVIKGDDMARTLMDISKNSSVYAVDQKYVSNIMLTSISRLQSLGASYDEAKDKAKAYVDALTGNKAPEFMKALSGQRIVGGIQKSLKGASLGDIDSAGFAAGKGKKFMEEYGDSLEKAQPGLSKRIAKIVADPRMHLYDKQRLVQEMTAGTGVGIDSMAKELNKVIKQTGRSTEVISDMYGVTRDQAYAMITENDSYMASLEKTNKLVGAGTEALMNQLGISKEEAEAIKGKKGLIMEVVQAKEREKIIQDDLKTKADRQAKAQEKILSLTKEIEKANEDLSKIKDKDGIARAQAHKKALEMDLQGQEAIAYSSADDVEKKIKELKDEQDKADKAGDKDKSADITKQLKRLGEIQKDIKEKGLTPGDKQLVALQAGTNKVLETMAATNLASGNSVLAAIEKMSNVYALLAGAAGLAGVNILLASIGLDTKLILARMALGGGGGAGVAEAVASKLGPLSGAIAGLASLASVVAPLSAAALAMGDFFTEYQKDKKGYKKGLDEQFNTKDLNKLSSNILNHPVRAIEALGLNAGDVAGSMGVNSFFGIGADSKDKNTKAHLEEVADLQKKLGDAQGKGDQGQADSIQLDIAKKLALFQETERRRAELRAQKGYKVENQANSDYDSKVGWGSHFTEEGVNSWGALGHSKDEDEINRKLQEEAAQRLKSIDAKFSANPPSPSPPTVLGKEPSKILGQEPAPSPTPTSLGKGDVPGQPQVTPTPIPAKTTKGSQQTSDGTPSASAAVAMAASAASANQMVAANAGAAASMSATQVPTNAPPTGATLGDPTAFGLPAAPGATPTPQSSSSAPNSSVNQGGGGGGGVEGAFVGGVNSDGSVNMRVTNFMEAFSSARAKSTLTGVNP